MSTPFSWAIYRDAFISYKFRTLVWKICSTKHIDEFQLARQQSKYFTVNSPELNEVGYFAKVQTVDPVFDRCYFNRHISQCFWPLPTLLHKLTLSQKKQTLKVWRNGDILKFVCFILLYILTIDGLCYRNLRHGVYGVYRTGMILGNDFRERYLL